MQLQFKYSLKEDLRWIYKTLREFKQLEDKGLLVFFPSIQKTFSLWLKRPKTIDVEVRYPITCYWRSAGTWGGFTPPNKIYICPWKKTGGMYTTEELKRVIYHEIFHLYYFEETKNLSFKDREKYINLKMKEELPMVKAILGQRF